MNIVLDHLWQSTAMLAVIGLLTLLFRNNGAGVRHALWLAASLKFLVPFALLTMLGEAMAPLLFSPLPAPPLHRAVQGVALSFSGPRLPAAAAPGLDWLPLLAAVWAVGFAALCGIWLARWRGLRAALRGATGFSMDAPMPVLLSPAALEPGLVGVLRPVLVLPEGIADRLTPAELKSLLAHEVCHLRRHDNLTAALHMLVETIFWFWPPVWWLGARLVAERERACDEAVLAAGNDPQVYAEGILKVCKFYVSSPLACAAGVSGGDLKQRMETIMENRISLRLNAARRILLAAAAALAVAAPITAGMLQAPPAFAQSGRTAPSPGTEAALRRLTQAWAANRPAPDGIADPMAAQRKSFGPLKSVTFLGADEGMLQDDVPYDVYRLDFQNARTVWAILPLRNGKVVDLQAHFVTPREDANTPSPGVEKVLRRLIGGLLSGDLPTDALTPILMQMVNGMSPEDARTLGKLKSLTFKGVSFLTYDKYEAVYEHGRALWSVEPLMADGRMNMAFVNGLRLDVAGRRADAAPNPGSEAMLRRMLNGMADKRPNIAEMDANLARASVEAKPALDKLADETGRLKSLTFRQHEGGNDLYLAEMQNGYLLCVIGPAQNGKVSTLMLQQVSGRKEMESWRLENGRLKGA